MPIRAARAEGELTGRLQSGGLSLQSRRVLDLWETYIPAEDAVSAVRVAVARIQDEPDAIRKEVRAAHIWN